jgi:cyclase
MAVKKIIPCLDVYGGKTVKGVNFVDLKEVGDAVELGRKYASEGADELVYLDISATNEERRTFIDLVEKLTAAIDIPLTVGGGIASLDDVTRLLDAGASRVSINSAAILNPSLIDEIAARYGSDAVVAAIDGKLDAEGVWRVTTHGGTRISERELFAWAREVEQRGAGQILFTSMEHDGTRKGYPVELFAALADAVSIPIIASGGAGSVADIAEVLTAGRADAALAASIFHYGEIPIPVLKRELRALGIEVNI